MLMDLMLGSIPSISCTIVCSSRAILDRMLNIVHRRSYGPLFFPSVFCSLYARFLLIVFMRPTTVGRRHCFRVAVPAGRPCGPVVYLSVRPVRSSVYPSVRPSVCPLIPVLRDAMSLSLPQIFIARMEITAEKIFKVIDQRSEISEEMNYLFI